MGMGGPVDINHLAIHEAMKLYEIEDKRGCFEKVIKLAAHTIAKINEQAKCQK